MNDQAGVMPLSLQVRAKFASSDQMQNAVSKLSMSGFDRANISLPSRGMTEGPETLEAATKPAATESDARQVRTLGASMAAAAAGLAAAGVTVATGGAALPAVAAAVVAGGAAGGSVFGIHAVANHSEQSDRDARAESGDLILAVGVATDEKRAEATAIMKAAGGTDVQTVV